MRVQIEEPPLRASSYLWYGSMGALAITGQAVMVAFLTYFLLVANDLFKRKLVKHIGPTLARKRVTVQILDEISTQIERFLLVQMRDQRDRRDRDRAGAVGARAASSRWCGAWPPACSTPSPTSGRSSSPPAWPSSASCSSARIEMALVVASVALVITSLEGWLLTPILLGRVGSLNHIAIFASLLFWSWMWGVWGMLLAVPMLMATKAVCDHVEELQPLADFLGE